MKYPTDKVVSLQGKEYILFEGLLEIAHKNYELEEIDTSNIVQLPNEENQSTAIIHAIVKTKDGKRFSAIGDASPENTNSKIAKHLIRMAETRAVGRALRFLTGYGTVFEELGEIEGKVSNNNESDYSSNSSNSKSPNSESSLDTSEPAAPAQMRKIEKRAKQLNSTVEELVKEFKDEDGEWNDYPSLTREVASRMIKWLKDYSQKEVKGGQSLPF